MVAVVVDARSFAQAPDQSVLLAELNLSQIPTFVLHKDDDIGAALSATAVGPAPDARVRGVRVGTGS